MRIENTLPDHMESSKDIQDNASIDAQYITLQRDILYAQGRSWLLNIKGWNDRNQTTRK